MADNEIQAIVINNAYISLPLFAAKIIVATINKIRVAKLFEDFRAIAS